MMSVIDNKVVQRESRSRSRSRSSSAVVINQLEEKKFGLDPLFRICMKLKVKDILTLQTVVHQSDSTSGARSTSTSENCRSANAFYYKTHIVNRIQLMGIVVKTEKYDRCHTYTVDDGTGVIECKCWKNERNVSEMDAQQLPKSLREKYKELQVYRYSRDEEGYTLGDLILVRGRISVYRERKEIDVIDHRKVENPEKELEAVLELPALYEIYNKPFEPPRTVAEQLSGLGDSANKFNEYTVQQAIAQHIQDPACTQAMISLPHILSWPPVAALIQASKDNQGDIDEDEHFSVVKSVLATMESSKGNVCQHKKGEGVYEIIKANCPLAVKTLSLLTEKSQTDYNASDGHSIYSMTHLVKSRYPSEYANLETKVMSYVLSCLEDSSDIICVGMDRYLPV